MGGQVYKNIGQLHPKHSVFNNSFTVQFNCDMGQLIPVYCEECAPNERFNISCESVVRFQPMIAPVLHEIYLRTFYYFVPTRLLMDRYTVDELGDDGEWSDFITGGPDGNDETTLPVWGSTRLSDGTNPFPFPVVGYKKYDLWDYFGFPLGVKPTEASMPLSFNKRAYNLVWNEYFRDQNLQDKVSLDSDIVLNISWSKDRFTTALYDTQRGDRPAIPLGGNLRAEFTGGDDLLGEAFSFPVTRHNYTVSNPPPPSTSLFTPNPFNPVNGYEDNLQLKGNDGLREWLGNNKIDFTNAVTFDAMDFRRLMYMQKYLERNMRSGARLTEQIRSRFGVTPQDMRLQRPEFIGGTRSPVIVSEVLQTSQTTTGQNGSPQGNLAGHGISAESGRVGYYHTREHGYIIGLCCVQPVPMYNQGINKQWTRRTRYDFLTPELVHMSEQAIKNSELVVTGTPRDDEIFGFQGIYDELRIKESRVMGDMRDNLSYWNLFRNDYDKDHPPSLNANFIKCVPSKRIFAVHDEPGLIINFANKVRAVRLLPIIAEPGM